MKFILLIASLISISANAGIVDGGVSGGGGNLISPKAPTVKQDPREIRNIILGSQNLLKKFINAKYALYQTGSMDYESHRLYSVLFADNEDNLHEVMEEITLDVQINKSCFDQNGKAYDGSTFNQKRHSICISAQSIAAKCDKFEVPLQSTALVLHEYSELVGLSDDDAITLQKQVIAELKLW